MGCPPIMSQDTWKFWGKTSSRFDPGVNLLIIGQLNPKRPKQEHIYIIHYISPCLCFCSILILILVGGLEHIYINSIWPTNGMLFLFPYIGSTTNQLYFFTSFSVVPGPGFPSELSRTGLAGRAPGTWTSVNPRSARWTSRTPSASQPRRPGWWSWERTFIGHLLGILPMGSCYIYSL